MKRGTKGEGKMNVCRMGIDLTGFRGRWRQCVLLSNFKLVNYLQKKCTRWPVIAEHVPLHISIYDKH